MPELPDLEAIGSALGSRIGGVTIRNVDIMQPLVIRQPTIEEFRSILTGNSFAGIDRRGKFLLIELESGHVLAIHFMLTGRLQYCDRKEKLKPKTCFVLSLSDANQIRYFDSKLMGKIYLLPEGKLSQIPKWNEMGPDATDSNLTLDMFRQRIRRYTGQIKNVLLNDSFVAGIGNAYADEILWEAGIYPFWPRAGLSDEEIESLYTAMRSVLSGATEVLKVRMSDEIGNISEEVRDFLKVHRRGGQPCPRCGSSISQVNVNRRITSFCRQCQSERKGGLLEGIVNPTT